MSISIPIITPPIRHTPNIVKVILSDLGIIGAFAASASAFALAVAAFNLAISKSLSVSTFSRFSKVDSGTAISGETTDFSVSAVGLFLGVDGVGWSVAFFPFRKLLSGVSICSSVVDGRHRCDYSIGEFGAVCVCRHLPCAVLWSVLCSPVDVAFRRHRDWTPWALWAF